MKPEFPQELKQLFTAARDDLQRLKLDLDRVQTLIEADKLIPDSLYLNVISSLEKCRNSKVTLTESVEKYAISVEASLAEMEQAIHDALAGAEIRALLADYFRLTSDAETVLTRLNESKKELQTEYNRNQGIRKEALAPYQIVVDYVSGKMGEITDEQSEIIEEVMSRTISRALDKGQIRFGDAAEGEKWLEGLADTPAVSETEHKEDKPQSRGDDAQEEHTMEEDAPKAETKTPKADITEEKSSFEQDMADNTDHPRAEVSDTAPAEAEASEEGQGDDTVTAKDEAEGMWFVFHSYIEPGAVSFDDVPASKFRESDFHGMARKNALHPIVLKALLDARLFPADADNEAFHEAGLNSKKEVEYLRGRGYVTMVHFTESDGTVKDYYALSSKGYAAFSNKTILNNYRGKQLAREFNAYIFSARKPVVFSDLYFQRCKLFSDWYHSCANKPFEGLFPRLVCADQNTDYLYYSFPDKKKSFIVPAVFERGKEQETIDIVTAAIKQYRNNCRVIFILKDEEDIRPVASAVCLEHPEYLEYLCFTIPESNAYYDGSGERVHDVGIEGVKKEEETSSSTETPEPIAEAAPAREAEPAADTLSEDSGESEAMKKTETFVHEETVLPAEDTASSPKAVRLLPTAEAMHEKENISASKALDVLEIRNYVQKYEKKAYEAFASGRNDIGSVLLKALCFETENIADLMPEHEQLVAKNAQYSFATGDPMRQEDYRISHLQTVFSAPFGIDEAYDALAIAAYLRMYFSADASIEYYGVSSVQFPENILLKSIAPLNDLLYKLADHVKGFFSGIDNQVLSNVFNRGNVNDKLAKAQKEAADSIVENRLTSTNRSNRRIIENRKLLFGGNSPVYVALETVSRNDISGIANVYKAMELVSGRITPQNIEIMMDEAWDRTAYGNDRAPLIGNERSFLKKKLISIYQIFTDWLEAVQISKKAADSGSSALQQTLSYVHEKLAAIRDSFADLNKPESVEQLGARQILQTTIDELLERFTTSDIEDRLAMDYYIRLLEHPLVAVTDGFVPYIERPAEETSPFNFCERAVKYLDLPRVEWPDAITRIFRKSADRTGGDYGCANVLHDYLELTNRLDIWPHEYENISRFIDDAQNPRSKAIDAVQTWQRDFQGRLDMADGDEWFREPDERKRLQDIIDLQQCSYFFSNNFGFYGRAMLRVLENMSKEAEQLRSEYSAQLAQVRANNSIAVDAPIYVLAASMIEKNRFGAFRSYLQMAERGETDVSESRLSDSKSYFATFVNQCKEYCEKARLTRERTTLQTVFRHFGYQQNATGRTGMTLVQNWPESENSNPQAQAEKIRGITEALGLQVEKQYPVGNGVHLDLKDPGRVLNYPHPMADFGSRMYTNGLQVHALYGNLTADVLVSKVREILQKNSQNSFLILVNCALQLQERRRLSRLVSSGMMQSPFIILDRALALYLATIPQAERWKALLQCALPFQIINPYSENSAVEIPPEMFIGRARELDSIRHPEGANLIYGGRQLGKTALLKRARVLEHRVEEQSWAVYEDIKNKTSAAAAVRIAKTLTQEKFFGKLPEVDSWEKLIGEIENQLMDKNSRRLLLLLDEADAFLAAAGRNEYAEIDELKRLQDRTRGRFKCVMAGLHNVLRLNNESALKNNSSLAHLQGLTVEPLDFKDARALLEVPLSYLGFTIPEEDEDIITQILYNTNYFPGLVHFYASRLVEYAKSHASEMNEPPYELKTDTLLSLLAEKDFHDLRNDRIRMTLYIDANEHSYYDILATTLCYGYNISDDYKLLGMTADDIRRECCEIAPSCSIGRLNNSQLNALLDELVTLNIFRVENGRYLFRRASFTEIFDSPEEVEQHFLEILEKEAN